MNGIASSNDIATLTAITMLRDILLTNIIKIPSYTHHVRQYIFGNLIVYKTVYNSHQDMIFTLCNKGILIFAMYIVTTTTCSELLSSLTEFFE